MDRSKGCIWQSDVFCAATPGEVPDMIPFHKKTIFCTIRMIIPVDIHTHRRPQVPGTAIVNCFPESIVPQKEGWYSVGIHPWYIASFAASLNDSKARFEELLDHPQVLAVGEAGLDKLAEAPLTLQIEVFEYQARLAEEANKPLIIHLVKAVDELLKLKQKIQPVKPWIIHGFRGKAALAEEYLRHGFYLSFGEKYQDNDKAYDTNMYTRPEIERILKVGFEYAMKRRKHLTVVDKANVLASSRLWRQIAQEMAPQYPEVTTDYMFVDNAAMKMIQDLCFFDVMVTENTFGDILTDEGSVISGSMGLLPSASTGESTPVFEPIHGSWPQAKGLNIANPLAQILSVAMLFEYFNCKEEGALIRRAVDASLDANVRTPEIQVEGGAKYGTKEVGAWIVDYIKQA